MPSTQELRDLFVPQLFTFVYRWEPKHSVSAFGIVMKNEYHIVAIGPSPSPPANSQEVVRALYASDIKMRGDVKEHIGV